jgi:uroporphyrinogen-III decarboxylase
MNDFQYPASKTGRWYELKPVDSPYPRQLETLKLVHDGLRGDAYFIDTLYGPYMTAMIMFQSQPEFAKFTQAEGEKKVIPAIAAFQRKHPDAWHAALDAITQSTINHLHRSREIGASGALVSLFNTESIYGSVEDYNRFSRPYDKRVLDALTGTKLTILHLHNLDRAYLGQFADFYAPVLQYSVKVSGIPITEVRKVYSQVIATGVDEVDFRTLTTAEIRSQWEAARSAAGPKYIAMPGCSVPNDSTPEELSRFPRSLGV